MEFNSVFKVLMMVYCYTFPLNFLQIFGKSFHKYKKGTECEIYQILNYGISQACLLTKFIIVCKFIVEKVDPQIYSLINFALYFRY